MVALLLAAGALILSDHARASYIVARNALRPNLQVDSSGRALVTYTADGNEQHLVLWGAVDARPPAKGGQQVEFAVEQGSGAVEGFANACKTYDGPALPWYVAGSGCKAPDGSYGALQSWQRMLPNTGLPPTADQAVQELHVWHWKMPLARLQVWQDWAWGGRYRQLVGQLTYGGKPVYGFGVTKGGAPTDAWGRNLYLDTFDSAYGPGWKRENSFLAQNGNGGFCYTFVPHRPPPGSRSSALRDGVGRKYRITVLGPGVTPIVTWEGTDVGAWSKSNASKAKRELAVNGVVRSLGFPPSACHD